MRIAVLDRNNRVTNVLGLPPGVEPDMLKRIEKWLLAPDFPITPGWRYDEKFQALPAAPRSLGCAPSQISRGDRAARFPIAHLTRTAFLIAHGGATSAAMLELRPNCECCDRDLPPDSPDARICTFECTFCAACVDGHLNGVCPNCGGNFEPRPIRPPALLARNPASTERVFKPRHGCDSPR